MSYPERGANYKNRPAWLDRAVEGEKRAEGGEVRGMADRMRDWAGQKKLSNEMGGPPPPVGFRVPRTKLEAEDSMRGQMERAKDISAAVPRARDPQQERQELQDQMKSPYSRGGRIRKRAEGGMTNAKLSQVAPEFEPAAAQDAREAAATRLRRGADRPKTMNSPMKRMAAVSDPEL